MKCNMPRNLFEIFRSCIAPSHSSVWSYWVFIICWVCQLKVSQVCPVTGKATLQSSPLAPAHTAL